MNCIWTDYELSLNRLWIVFKPTMNCLWIDYELSLNLLWIAVVQIIKHISKSKYTIVLI